MMAQRVTIPCRKRDRHIGHVLGTVWQLVAHFNGCGWSVLVPRRSLVRTQLLLAGTEGRQAGRGKSSDGLY